MCYYLRNLTRALTLGVKIQGVRKIEYYFYQNKTSYFIIETLFEAGYKIFLFSSLNNTQCT